MTRRSAIAAALAALTIIAIRASGAAPPSIDALFADYWRADGAGAREKVAARIVASGVTFDDAIERLRRGRIYGAARTGDQIVGVALNGYAFENTIAVPDDYDPSKRWPLRVQLHGGVGRPQPPDVKRRNRLEGEPAIYAMPVAWSGVEWWRDVQLANITQLVDRIKQRYNIDESRVYITGTSDGGTGVYYVLLRDATRWSAGLPLIGNPRVLSLPNLEVDGSLYANNLRNRPIFAVNAIGDPLYPADIVQQWAQLLADGGVEVVFHRQTGGHDVSWWEKERDNFASFVDKHPRAAHPERLTWETDRADRFNRIQWLVIDELGASSSDRPLRDIGVYADPGGASKSIFPKHAGSGRADVARSGNHFVAETRGVKAFTILLSPDAIDFAQPVTVTVNGIDVVGTAPQKSTDVLMRWAARDDDRTMLYGAELHVRVPERHTP